MKILLLALLLCSSIQTLWGCFVARNAKCPNENVTFWLYTNNSLNHPVQLNPLQLSFSDFVETQNSSLKELAILIHGYTGGRDYWPNPQLRPFLFIQYKYVISVDYGRLSPAPCYGEAALNTDLVSRCLAQLIDNLVREKILNNYNMHIIGFSLGAQVAGQTANYVQHKVERITGLDPARPLFINVPDSKRLDASDAQFVDVIHTNTLERGVLRPIGHMDFYPNFGSLVQPGCELTEFPGSCSHNRAVEFYAESLQFPYRFMARKCKTWVHYLLGQCEEGQQKFVLMGELANGETQGSFFLKTSASSPYGQGYDGAMVSANDSNLVLRLASDDFMDGIESALSTLFLYKQNSEYISNQHH
ncbi:hypothetical protein KR222_010419 [Zaprionus bogoriensis]|nr:hypothetical protein KR222_010419 [Zaprionus bogoriensis]